MKKPLSILLVLLATLCCVMSAAADNSIEKQFDKEKDIVITCETPLGAFDGKTIEGDVYVLLAGCTNLQSSVLPGSNSFLTLRDITVNGTLYYVDDRYDESTNTYQESGIRDNITTADHYLNIAGNSYIENTYMECMNPHGCNLGTQYPTVINNMHIVPTNSASRGNISVRGYIDPLADPETDYYTDTEIKNYPDFNFSTFDNDFANPILKINKLFLKESQTVARDGITYGSRIRSNDFFYNYFVESEYQTPPKIAVTNVLFHRGQINNLYIYNKYLVGIGETNIDLKNLCVEIAMITNGETYDSTTAADFSRAWVPVLRGGGLTNFGIVSVYSQLKTDLPVNEPYSFIAENTDNAVSPMYIDVMVVGTEGLTEKITLSSVKIAMLQYLGGMSPYSVLDLTFAPPDSVNLNLVPGIGILIAHGGRINLNANFYFSNVFYIGAFWLFSGREDLRFAADTNGISSAAGILTLPVSEDGDNTSRSRVYNAEEFEKNERSIREGLCALYDEQYDYTSGNIYQWTQTFSTTAAGANWIVYVLDKYRKPAPADVKQAYTTQISLGAVSFGDINVDSLLESVIGSNWFNATCAVHQYGEKASTGAKIIHISGN